MKSEKATQNVINAKEVIDQARESLKVIFTVYTVTYMTWNWSIVISWLHAKVDLSVLKHKMSLDEINLQISIDQIQII